MTDKVQKIREEVARIQLYTQSEVLKQVLDYIDEVQKEPVSIWHDVSEEPCEDRQVLVCLSGNYYVDFYHKKDKRFYMCFNPHHYLCKVDRWAYIDDIIKRSNVQGTTKNCKEPVSEDLGDYINELSKQFPEISFAKLSRIAVRVAKWQKANLWKPADGDDLPEYEQEVVVFTQNFPNDAGIMSVSIAHRPNPDGFDGKSLTTGEVEHYTPKTYDKGGWNIPNVKWWLDVDKLPNVEDKI